MGNLGDAAFSQGDVMRRLRELEGLVAELIAGRRLENATIGAGGIRVASGGVIRSTDFDGNLALSDPGTKGWALGGTGLLAFDGQIASAVEFGSAGNAGQNFSVTTTDSVKASTTLAVPDWVDEAIVFAIAPFSFHNTSAVNQGVVHCRVEINGVSGGTVGESFDVVGTPSSVGSMTPATNRILSNPASPITIQAFAFTTVSSIPADVDNLINLEAIAIFRSVS